LDVFFSSFAIFPLFAFTPLMLQVAQGHSPMLVGMAMLSLSLGWSLGSLGMGQVVHRLGERLVAIYGGMVLVAGCALTLSFQVLDSPWWTFVVFLLVGLGMGFVTLSTLLVVQQSVDQRDLGVATSSHQFARTLGGTVGIGLCGGLVNMRLERFFNVQALGDSVAASGKAFAESPAAHLQALLKPEMQQGLPQPVSAAFQTAVTGGVTWVFWAVLAAALCCAAVCLRLPADRPARI
jgi:MFS family permease